MLLLRRAGGACHQCSSSAAPADGAGRCQARLGPSDGRELLVPSAVRFACWRVHSMPSAGRRRRWPQWTPAPAYRPTHQHPLAPLTNNGAKVNHRPLGPHWQPRPHGCHRRQELDCKCLEVEDLEFEGRGWMGGWVNEWVGGWETGWVVHPTHPLGPPSCSLSRPTYRTQENGGEVGHHLSHYPGRRYPHRPTHTVHTDLHAPAEHSAAQHIPWA